MSREIAGTKVILPIWHKITVDEVRQHSPILAGRMAAKVRTWPRKGGVSEVREAMGFVNMAESSQGKQITDYVSRKIRPLPGRGAKRWWNEVLSILLMS